MEITLNTETHLHKFRIFFEVCIKLEFKHEIVIQKGENAGKEGELALEYRL